MTQKITKGLLLARFHRAGLNPSTIVRPAISGEHAHCWKIRWCWHTRAGMTMESWHDVVMESAAKIPDLIIESGGYSERWRKYPEFSEFNAAIKVTMRDAV